MPFVFSENDIYFYDFAVNWILKALKNSRSIVSKIKGNQKANWIILYSKLNCTIYYVGINLSSTILFYDS